MKVLAIDTSGSNCSCCLTDEKNVICDFNLNIGATHSETLLPMIDEIFKFSKLDIRDVDVLACSIGPGSFTGLRIGLATIKGFALTLDKKVIGVSTLLALANNVSNFDGIICSILDARNNNVYAGLYKYIENEVVQIDDYIVEDLDTLITILKKQNSKIMFVGDGSVSFKDNFEKELVEKAYFAPFHLNNQLSSSVAKIAIKRALKDDFDNQDTLNPLYLKKSQAERMLENN